MKNLNQFDNKKNMSKSFIIKKYWVLTLCLLFCSLTAVAQEYNDETIGFDAAKETAILKKYGVSDKDLSRELNMKRKMFTQSYITLEKINKNILQNIDSDSKNVQKTAKPTSKLTTQTMAVTAVDVPQSERDVLQAFYNIADNKASLTGWDFNTPVTSGTYIGGSGWRGVQVTNGHITILNIPSVANLNGIIPNNIDQLIKLEHLSISNHPNLKGSFPTSIYNLTDLITFDMTNPNITGSVSNQISNLTKLKTFNLALSGNKFNNKISNEIFKLSNLQSINLMNVNLELPPSIQQLTNLTVFRLYDCNVDGGLPREIGLLTNLLLIDISNTEITGTIPSEIFQLPNLEHLTIYGSSNLTGTLPPVLNLPSMDQIYLSYNNLTGTVPICNCPIINGVGLRGNQFNSLPPNLNTFNDLRNNKLSFNDLILTNGNAFSNSLVFYTPQSLTDNKETINVQQESSITLKMFDDDDTNINDTFQWYKGISPNGIAIQGATSRTYTLSNLTNLDAGNYYCVAKNIQFPDLILEREPITLNVNCDPITGIIKIIKDTGYPFQFSNSGLTSILACNETSFPNKFYANTAALNIGTKLFTNQSLSTPVPVTNSFAWYKVQGNTTAYKVDATGKITEVYTCSASTCSKRFLDYVTVVAQEPITLNYFLPNGTEVNKTFEPVPRGGDQTYTFSVAACISETSLTIDGPVLSQIVSWNDNQNCCQATSRAYRFSSPGRDSAGEACSAKTFPDTFYAASTSLGIGTQLYLDPELKNRVGSGNSWRQEGIDGYTIRIANDGTVAEFSNCGAEQPTTTTYGYRAMHPYEHTGTDSVIYIDANGVEQQIDLPRAGAGENIDTAPCIKIVAQRIVSHSGVTSCTP